MRTIIFGALLAACIFAGGVVAVREWRARVIARLEERAFRQATRFLREGRAQDALAVADGQVRSDAKFAWSALELEALIAMRHISRLVSVYSHAPERVLANEEGSLLVARAFFAARQREDFASVRAAWRGREARPELWLALDSDILGLEGQGSEAEQLLRSRKFEGNAEATRLIRLALHAVRRSLHESWSLLDEAYSLAPRNPEIRSFRAQILEAIERPSEARVEYVAAVVADPRNPLLRDELAEFYRRRGSYELALQTWREALAEGAPDFVALKETFWSRVIQPAAHRPAAHRGSGPLAGLVEFVRSLPADRFWDAESFDRLPQSERFAHERPEVFWLHILELLRTGRENEAAEKLASNRFQSRSWRPDLERGLAQILNYRAHGLFTVGGRSASGVFTNQHPFLRELEIAASTEKEGRNSLSASDALTRLVTGENAFAAAFLAAGWREAALRFVRLPSRSEDPAWFSFGLGQCLRMNRGNAAALEYLSRQPAMEELVVLRGELLLAENRIQEATRDLESIVKVDSDAGLRAGWLLAQAAIGAGELNRVREIVQGQPRLADSTLGRELNAQVAFLGGDVARAEQLYRAIAGESIEARAFLARRAYERRDWTTARQYTEALRRLLPDELQIRENLFAIAKAEGAHESQ